MKALLIPTSALVNKGELSGIYTVSQSNTAVLRWLRLGRTYGDKVEILVHFDKAVSVHGCPWLNLNVGQEKEAIKKVKKTS